MVIQISTCSCSEWFGGVDVMGRMTCAEGECPKGFELRPDTATGIKACSADYVFLDMARLLQERTNALLV